MDVSDQNRSDDRIPEGDREFQQNKGYCFQNKNEIVENYFSTDSKPSSSIIQTSICSSEVNSNEKEEIMCEKMDFVCNKESKVSQEKPNNDCRWISQVDENTERISYVDTHTGNSTYMKPQIMQGITTGFDEINNFENDQNKKHFFLTHDCSPFLKDSKDEKVASCSDTKVLQSNLTTFIKKLDEEDNVKWRDSKEIDDNSTNNITELLSNWKNPMFYASSEANEVNKPGITLPQKYTINSYRFNKNTLESLKVIGQVDCKFIACILEDFNEKNKDERVLVLFDQHAVHERIRLEELIEDLYEISEGEKVVKSVKINPFVKLTFATHEMRLINAYQNRFKVLGVHLSVKSDRDVEVTSIPTCLVDVNTNKLKRSFMEVSAVIEKSIRECLTTLTESRIISSVLPKALTSVLNAQACRGAIKFGDPLDFTECKKLLSTLSECKLPFQCAHGRPSIAPILDLNKIESLTKKCSPPQLHQLIVYEGQLWNEI